MLRPSYSDLMNVMNQDKDLDNMVKSRYTIVIAVSKRARQIIDGQKPLCEATTDKAVSFAVNEMNNNLIKTYPDVSDVPVIGNAIKGTFMYESYKRYGDNEGFYEDESDEVDDFDKPVKKEKGAFGSAFEFSSDEDSEDEDLELDVEFADDAIFEDSDDDYE